MPATSLIKCDVQIWDLIEQWRDFVDGGNGCLYEIPWNYQWVVELSLEDKNLKEIRPDLRWKYMKYWRGIKVDNGSIYCMPFNDSRLKNLLKIIPKEGKDIPTSRNWLDILLSSCLLSRYWCRILNLDPNDDNLSLVGEEVDKCFRTVVLGDYGCIYGRSEKVVIKFNAIYEFV